MGKRKGETSGRGQRQDQWHCLRVILDVAAAAAADADAERALTSPPYIHFTAGTKTTTTKKPYTVLARSGLFRSSRLLRYSHVASARPDNNFISFFVLLIGILIIAFLYVIQLISPREKTLLFIHKNKLRTIKNIINLKQYNSYSGAGAETMKLAILSLIRSVALAHPGFIT